MSSFELNRLRDRIVAEISSLTLLIAENEGTSLLVACRGGAALTLKGTLKTNMIGPQMRLREEVLHDLVEQAGFNPANFEYIPLDRYYRKVLASKKGILEELTC